MFTTHDDRISADAKRELVADTAKITRMVDSVASYLSDVLQLKDPEVSGQAPLAEVCRQEVMHLMAAARNARQMGALHTTYEFVVRAEDFACRVRECALRARGHNVDLNCFTHEDAYFLEDEVTKRLGTKITRVEVGGLGERVMNEVASSARAWMDDLDRVLSDAAGIERSAEATEGLAVTKGRLALALAKRVSIMSLESVLDDGLSSRVLGDMVEEEYARCAPQASDVMRGDVNSLLLLRGLAQSSNVEETRRTLVDSLPEISRAVHNVPCETTSHAESMELGQLARALVPGLDIEIRVQLVQFWADNCGEAAVRSIDAALARMREWSPRAEVEKFTSLRRGGGTAGARFAVPPMPFLHAPRSFAKRDAGARRSGLDERGERAVRLVRYVWEIASRGVVREGVVAAEPLAAVALDSMIMCRMAANLINTERDLNRPGTRLCSFLVRLQDLEGPHAADVARATCALSNFSCDELATAFRSDSDILLRVCGDLTHSTQDKMIFRVNPAYKSFATEALAFALPLVQQRRERMGLPNCMRSVPILDLLRGMPKAFEWTPLKGKLCLRLEDLKGAHRCTRDALEALHAHHVLVKRKGGGKKAIVYEFDTPMLAALMRGRP